MNCAGDGEPVTVIEAEWEGVRCCAVLIRPSQQERWPETPVAATVEMTALEGAGDVGGTRDAQDRGARGCPAAVREWGVRDFAKVLLLGFAGCMLAGCKTLPPPTPLSELNAQQSRGHTVFETRCGACHYDRKNDALHGPPLLGVFKKPALPSGAAATDERVTATIEHGRGTMPAMGNVMEQQDVADVLAYLHTL